MSSIRGGLASVLFLTVLAGGARAAGSGTADYLKGLDAMEAGHWADAATAFGKAIDAESENAAYYTARGVAYTLAEKFPQAFKDLERSLKLRPNDHETKLWLAVAYRMGGEIDKAASLFYFSSDVPADYTAFIYNDMANEYWRAVVKKLQTGKTGREGFKKAGAWFAQRAKPGSAGGQQELPKALIARARQHFDHKEYAAALADIEPARIARPDDMDVLDLHAWCKLELGDAETARQEFTRVLTAKTDRGEAYLGRARAEAKLGNLKRARADLDVATKLNPQGMEQQRAQSEKEVKAAPAAPTQEPSALMAALVQEARSGGKNVVDRALALRKAVNARRRRLDEDYQDRLHTFEAALAAAPKNPDRLADLAAFLYREADVSRERVEPRGDMQLYRFQTQEGQSKELDRALQLCDQALAINPRHQLGLVTKAGIAMWQLRFGDAQPLVNQLIEQGAADDPMVALVVLQFMAADAARRSWQAQDLRSTKTWSDTYYIYWRRPSEEELRRADELNRQADELLKLGVRCLESAAKAHPGTADGLFCQGILQRRQGNLTAARDSLEQAVKLKSDFKDAWFQLAALYARLGQTDKEVDARVRADNLVQTTAARLLKLAWSQITSTKWQSAKATLKSAADLDAADARIPAYLAVIAQGEEKPDDALAYFRAAVALEEARARLSGTTFAASGTDARPASEFGMTLVCGQQLGEMLLQRKQPAAALEQFQAIEKVGKRVAQQEWGTEVPTAMLPDPNQETGTVPEARILAGHLMWAKLDAGRALLALKREAEAVKEWQDLVTFVENPTSLSTSPGKKAMDEPKAWAALEMAKFRLAKGDKAGARMWLNKAGSWSKAAETERKRIETELSRR